MSKVLVDLSTVLRPRKPLADSTLNNMRKSDLIQYIRALERAHDIAVATLNQQAENVKDWMPMEWISVKDRLPEEPGQYLVRFKCGTFQVGRYVPQFHRWGVAGSSPVTHWMPLPDPPEDCHD